MKDILIIGGAGFIGSNTARYYLEKGNNVAIIDNLSRVGSEYNLEWLKKFSVDLEFIKCDIVSDLDKLHDAVKNKDLIFHFAGQVAVTTSIMNPSEDFMINALGTINILESIRQFNKEAILLYSSTNKVYGDLEYLETTIIDNRYQFASLKHGVDESTSLDFISPYGCSKGAADQYVRDYARTYNLNTIIFRQSCIYGYRQMGIEDQGWIAWFINASLFDQQITIYGDGKQVRDVLFIDDLVRALDLATSNPKTYGKVYNMGGGIKYQLSLIELLSILEKILNKKLNIKYTEKRLGDQSIFVCDIRKAKLDFNWNPAIGIEDGVQRLIKWVYNNKSLFSNIL